MRASPLGETYCGGVHFDPAGRVAIYALGSEKYRQLHMITLQPVDQNNWRATLMLSVRPDQQRFVSEHMPVSAIALAKAYVGALGMTWLPRAFFADQIMIGFCALARAPAPAADLWLFHFFIDQRYQRQGFGRQALQAVIALVSSMDAPFTSLCLTVHPENVMAQRLYQGAGFRHTGEQRDGELMYRRC